MNLENENRVAAALDALVDAAEEMAYTEEREEMFLNYRRAQYYLNKLLSEKLFELNFGEGGN